MPTIEGIDVNVVINAAAALAQLISSAVQSIHTSTTLSDEEKKAALDKLEMELDTSVQLVRARVQQFRDV